MMLKEHKKKHKHHRTSRYVNPEICLALPAFLAFTGSDYTAAFLCKGKSNPFQLMESNKYTEAFTLIGSSETIDPEVIAILEEYVCYLYGMENERDVNDARTELFKRLCGPGDLGKPLEKIKSTDPCCLPLP